MNETDRAFRAKTIEQRRLAGAIRTPAAFRRLFNVPPETIERLKIYEDLLRRWQNRINLVAPSTLDAVWERHFADSAQLLFFAPQGARHWLDLGSGAGFPGMVIAIMLANHDNSRVTLIESNTRKCAFLRDVARHTGAPVEILCYRIEAVARAARVRDADVITSRALAPLPQLLALCAPFMRPDSRALLLKGRSVQQEIDAARKKWRFECVRHQSLIDAQGSILEIWGIIGPEE